MRGKKNSFCLFLPLVFRLNPLLLLLMPHSSPFTKFILYILALFPFSLSSLSPTSSYLVCVLCSHFSSPCPLNCFFYLQHPSFLSSLLWSPLLPFPFNLLRISLPSVFLSYSFKFLCRFAFLTYLRRTPSVLLPLTSFSFFSRLSFRLHARAPLSLSHTHTV